MKRGYNELVGLEAMFNRVLARYRLTHHYQWRVNGKPSRQGTLRGYDMRRDIPVTEILRSLGDAYEPAILSVWRRITNWSLTVYYQLEVKATPKELELEGEWRLQAES